MFKGEKDKDDLQKLQTWIYAFNIQQVWKYECFKNFFFFSFPLKKYQEHFLVKWFDENSGIKGPV